MKEIVFSIFAPGKEAFSNLEILLKQFEQEKKIRVRLEVLAWTDGWKHQLDSAIHSSGPDISLTGNTWVKDLARMNALRPFPPGEIKKITSGKDYFPLSWSGVKESLHTTWAVPLVCGVRMVYYRRDLLKQAGVEEATAFQTIDNFEHTLAKLKANGHETPLAMCTLPANVNLQNLASWVWRSDANFFDNDGTNLAIDTPKALDGMKAYFRLGRYLGSRLNQEYSDNLFVGGQAAVLVSGYVNVTQEITNQVVRENLGVASVLGTSFVGLMDLIIWQHTLHWEEALELIQFLTKIETGKFLYPSWGLSPYQQGWNDELLKHHPDHSTKMHAIQNGRSFPDTRLWALAEKRISETIPQIWDAVLANPDESDKIVEEIIVPLARRLRLTFQA